MRTPLKLGLFGLVLAALFAASWGAASALMPTGAPQADADGTAPAAAPGTHDEQEERDGAPLDDAISGVSMSSTTMRLADVRAPAVVQEQGTLAFSIRDASGHPVTDYVETHEKRLHLIVVRSDGSHFRHVHPALEGGTWSLPWAWEAAGTYRVYADFTDAASGQPTTLTATVDVAGEFAPDRTTGESRITTAAGFTVAVEGALEAGEPRSLAFRVERDGEPVTTLEPYLGAFGHLVVLREGDLAYLHAHPEGASPKAGQRSGPDVGFAVTAPTAGRYFLYLDFQVDGAVHTARFALEAESGAGAGDASSGTEPSPHSEPSTHGH